jgi:hypothetical protein
MLIEGRAEEAHEVAVLQKRSAPLEWDRLMACG